MRKGVEAWEVTEQTGVEEPEVGETGEDLGDYLTSLWIGPTQGSSGGFRSGR